MANPKHTVDTIRPTIAVFLVSTRLMKTPQPEKGLFSLNGFGLPDRLCRACGAAVL